MSQSEVISVSYSCYFAGLMYFNGEGAPQDYNIAVEYLEKACRFKYGEACTLLGFAYGNGKGVKQNYSIARQFIHKGCRFGSQRACDFYKELNQLNQQGVR